MEETPNNLLEAEADKLTHAARYERNKARQGHRSGHYDRGLTTTSGEITLHVPRLKGISFETAIIERYRRRESSVEEALNEMYLNGDIGTPCRGYRGGAVVQQGIAVHDQRMEQEGICDTSELAHCPYQSMKSLEQMDREKHGANNCELA